MNVTIEQLQLMLERLLGEKSSLLIDNAVLREQVRDLRENLRSYATNAHLASNDPKHNRLDFDDCNHPDCATARVLLARGEADDE